jgi:hypothetical protein
MSDLIMVGWTDGGTGITNFDPKELPLYEAALEETKDEDLILVSRPFGRFCIPSDYSLHFKRGREKDLSDFWKVFDRIQQQKLTTK